jgi:hypothetical protein
VFSTLNRTAIFTAAVAIIYLVLAVIAFFTSGIEFRIGPLAVSATAPQKLLRIAIAIATLAALDSGGQPHDQGRGVTARRRDTGRLRPDSWWGICRWCCIQCWSSRPARRREWQTCTG